MPQLEVRVRGAVCVQQRREVLKRRDGKPAAATHHAGGGDERAVEIIHPIERRRRGTLRATATAAAQAVIARVRAGLAAADAPPRGGEVEVRVIAGDRVRIVSRTPAEPKPASYPGS